MGFIRAHRGFRDVTPITENHMETRMEHEMDTSWTMVDSRVYVLFQVV